MAAVLFSTPALAIGRVISPNVVKGELELEYMATNTFDDKGSKRGKQDHKLEVEYGLTDRVKLEFEAAFKKAAQDEVKFKKVEVGGIFQFFESGEYWVDSGAKLVYAHAMRDGDADAIEGKLLFEKSLGKFTHRLNLGLEHEVGNNAADGFERSARWSTRYRHDRHFEPGFEWQGDFGRASDHYSFDEQEHYAGPALYGDISSSVKYEAAYLFGVSDAASDGAARFFIEYEMYF
jgi:hypothetical protein